MTRSPILTVLAVLILSLSGCAGAFRSDDPWIAKDKAYHFIAGGVIGAGTTLAARHIGMEGDAAPAIGISASIAIGGGKEWYDAHIKGTYWSWKDMLWDLVGGTTGSYLVGNR
jgi:putative lipoprotein